MALGSSGQISLTWNTPRSNGGSSITGYTVYRGSSYGAETFQASIGNLTAYTDGPLNPGQTFYYEVAAVSAAGSGSFSNEASATTGQSGGGGGGGSGGSGGSGGTGASQSLPLQTFLFGAVIAMIAALTVVFLVFRRRKAKQSPS